MTKLQLDILSRFATEARVRPIVERIQALSDADIDHLVQTLGSRFVASWQPEDGHQMAAVLKHHRDLFRQVDFLRPYYDPHCDLDSVVRGLRNWQPAWSPEAESALRRHLDDTRHRLRNGDLPQRRLTFTPPLYISDLE